LDNLCHTLAGAALAEAGLKQRTRFGSAALMIAANLPDIDVLAIVSDTPAVALRRGWTHGVLAQALLPVLLTAALIAVGKRRNALSSGPPIRPWMLLLLSVAGVISHVAMDWLNNYGVRLLMPVSDRWFYGDAVFIVDPWLWGILASSTF
jgi:inner membrane protein